MNASVDDVKEFVAESREAALAMAAGHFRTSEDQLETWVIPPSVHISGLGDRILLIAALRSERGSRAPEPRREERREERREGRGGRDRDRDRGDRDRGERGDRGRERRSSRGNGHDEGGSRRSFDRPPREPAPVEEAEPALATTRSELSQVGVFVAGLVERMGLREVEVTEGETDDGETVVTLAGRAITALVERDPRVIAALSHLAHRAAEALLEDGAAAQVVVKGARRPREEGRDRPHRDGRREQRREGRGEGRGDRHGRGRDSDDRDIDEAELERLAKDAARSVRESGEPELLPPMNSRERWFIHNALKDERGVRSESEGDGARKRVKIFPA